MEIRDVQSNQGNIDLVLEVVAKEEPRTFEKFGNEGKVCTARVKDGSGEIKLTLWNDDIDKVNIGDKIHLQNGWCSEYQGEKQLSSGKFGKIEIVEKSAPGVVTNDPGMLQQASGEQPTSEPEDSPIVVDEEEVVE